MSNLWINIRFGNRHWQVEKGFKAWRYTKNSGHQHNPQRFQIYTFFGLEDLFNG
jgi:hypothetical protein